MSEYKTFKPTDEMLEDFKSRMIYRDAVDLEKDIHKQKMFIMSMFHRALPEDRTDFHKFYNEFHFELCYYARLIYNRELLWFKGNVEHYLKTQEPSYGVDLVVNDYMNNELDEPMEVTSIIARMFEDMLIQQLRGHLDYETQHEIWYERYNEYNGNLEWFDEELTKITHAVLAHEFSKYLYEPSDENDCESEDIESGEDEDNVEVEGQSIQIFLTEKQKEILEND